MIVWLSDLDSIDVSNLNRQFLFRKADVGKPKSQVAAAFIEKRVSGCKVTPYVGKIQDRDAAFYSQFKLIVVGLDNIEARRWLNSFITSLVQVDDEGGIDIDTVIPIIDGGTEGFRGQARVIIPRVTSCFECSLPLFPPQVGFAMCTLAETPRIPEHCIAYAFIKLWEDAFPTKKLDKDSPEDMKWVYEKALERAKTFGIEGVTYFKTIGVVKSIIPAVASTNAAISAACVNEAVKLITFGSQSLNNYYLYVGSEGMHSSTMEFARVDNCLVCGNNSVPIPILKPASMTLEELLKDLTEDATFQLKQPSVTAVGKTLYMRKPEFLEKATRANLGKCLGELISSGEVLTVTDPMLSAVSLNLKVELIDDISDTA